MTMLAFSSSGIARYRQFTSTPLTEEGTISVAHGEMPVLVPRCDAVEKRNDYSDYSRLHVKTELITPRGLALQSIVTTLNQSPPHLPSKVWDMDL